jgi:hypothetical protein
MFSLGEKLRVLNSNAEIKAFDSAGAAIVGAPTSITDSVLIEGFGEVKLSQITDIKLHRAVAAANESIDYAAVAPAGLAAGDVIEVIIKLKSSRYMSEVQTNFIGGAGMVKFSTAPLTATATTDVKAAIVAGWAAHKALFHNATLELEVVAGAGASDIQVNTLAGFESVNVEKVEIRRSNQGIAYQTPVALAAGTVNTAGTEGLGTGKFLEESVRMATGFNTNPYGVDTATTQVDVRGAYTSATVEVLLDVEENLGTSFAGQAGLKRKATFTAYCNEVTMMATNGAVDILAESAVLVAAAGVSAVSTTVSATPGSDEALIIADSTSVATAADFIA